MSDLERVKAPAAGATSVTRPTSDAPKVSVTRYSNVSSDGERRSRGVEELDSLPLYDTYP